MKQTMKGVMLLLVCTMAAACFTGCGSGAKEQAETDVILQGTDVILNDNSKQDLTEYTLPPAEGFEGTAIPSRLESMILPMDALNMMFTETEYHYDAADPVCFWSAVYYTAANYGYIHPAVEQVNDSYRLPAAAVQEIADAIFAEGGSISDTPIPEALSERIAFEEDTDSYLFGLGDRGLTEYEMYEYMESKDGSFDVSVRLYNIEDESTISTGTYHVVANPDTFEDENAIFHYRITSVKFERELP